jgi:hypothetical protein
MTSPPEGRFPLGYHFARTLPEGLHLELTLSVSVKLLLLAASPPASSGRDRCLLHRQTKFGTVIAFAIDLSSSCRLLKNAHLRLAVICRASLSGFQTPASGHFDSLKSDFFSYLYRTTLCL